MKEIRKRVWYNEDMKLDPYKQLIQIEAYKDDSNKCYQAIWIINSNTPKKLLIVHGKGMMYAGSEKEQANIITKHFKNMFTVVTADEPTIIKPAEMKTPFTTEEIEKASKSMKNQNSVREDGLNAEYVKYGPPEKINTQRNCDTTKCYSKITIIKPAEMKTPFTTEEIKKAAKSMKNQNSVGEDGLNAEYVKYGSPEIHNGIATL